MTRSLVPGVQPSQAGLPYRRLTFVPAQRADAHASAPTDDLIPLNDPVETPAAANMPAALQQQQHKQQQLVQPLFEEAKVPLRWSSVRRPGAGYVNQGNTCFMNSVLQCLTHTPPLAELCLSEQRLLPMKQPPDNNHPVVITKHHIKQSFNSTHPIRPTAHARTLRVINRRFRLGRQEDAHEYLRCMVDAMHEACLRPLKDRLPKELTNTTFVYRIFGGRLRSQIKCEGVQYTSSTYDPFLDLSLEISRASTLHSALEHFTAGEILDGDNRYRCPKNKQLVRAVKRITIEDAPNVLTIHLKRFDFQRQGRKLSKKVDFTFELDLGPYMSRRGAPGAHMYDLYAVLVHHGHSLHSGHYVCYVKAGNNLWYLCDDQRVAQSAPRQVEGQQAYILFYVRRMPKALPAAAAATAAAARAAAAAANDVLQQEQAQRQQAAATAARSAVASVGEAPRPVFGPQQQQQQQQQRAGRQQPQLAPPSGISAAPLDSQEPPGTSSTESTANAEGSGDNQPRRRRGVPVQLMLAPLGLSSLQRHLEGVEKLRQGRQKERQTPTHHQQHPGGVGPALGQGGGAGSPHEHHLHRHHHHHQLHHGEQLRSPKRLRGHVAAERAALGSQQPQSPHHHHHAHKRQKVGAGTAAAGGAVAEVVQQQQKQPRRVVPTPVMDAPQQQQEEQHQQQVRKKAHKHHHYQQQAEEEGGADAAAAAAGGSKPSRAAQPPKAVQASQGSKQQPRHQQQQQGALAVGASALKLLMADARAGAWDGAEQLKQTAVALERAAAPKRKRRDEYDVEYDRGKQKKVKQKKETVVVQAAERGGNMFQEAWDADLPAKARQEAMAGMAAGGRDGGGRGWGSRGRDGDRGGRRGGSRGGGRGQQQHHRHHHHHHHHQGDGGGRGGGRRGGRGGRFGGGRRGVGGRGGRGGGRGRGGSPR